MKKIVILQDLPQYHNAISEAAPGWDVVFTTNKEMAKEHLPHAEIIAGWSSLIPELALAPSSPLKWIQSWSAGVDGFPMDTLSARGIYLTTAGGVQARPVSETLFATLLALTRRMPQLIQAQTEKSWVRKEMFTPPMDEIHAKVLGVLGTGQIGQQVARIARAFSMRTVGYRKNGGLAPYFDSIYTGNNLPEMLSKCDYIVNLLPLTPHTRGIINKEAFGSMRKGSLYFSVGRGETTVTADLIQALQSGHLGGAGLDVFDPEPLPTDSLLWSMDNVIVTPHVGGSSLQYNRRVLEIFIENLQSYLMDGEPHRNLVNFGEGY